MRYLGDKLICGASEKFPTSAAKNLLFKATDWYRSKYRLIVEHLDAEMKWGNPRIKHLFGYSTVSLKLCLCDSEYSEKLKIKYFFYVLFRYNSYVCYFTWNDIRMKVILRSCINKINEYFDYIKKKKNLERSWEIHVLNSKIITDITSLRFTCKIWYPRSSIANNFL